MQERFSIAGKVAIVTGGGRGLGLTYAKALANAGALIAVCDKNADAMSELTDDFKNNGLDVLALPVDVTVKAEVDEFVAKVIEKYGRIDCLVNNAGVLLRRTPEEMSEKDWDFMMDINVKGTFLFAQAVGTHMIRQGSGSIVNIASIGGKVALDRRLGYCTSKAAVEHFTRVLSFEWGKYNVRVNAIAPGYIKSDMNADLRADSVRYQAMVDDVPLGRFGDPQDLVGTILFLLSDGAGYITGQTIYVDGGKTTH